MLTGLLILCGVLVLVTAVTVRWAFTTVENTNLLAAQERDALTAAHIAQLSEFANRIQQPYRASHVSISESAPPSEPTVHPDLEAEEVILEQTR